MVKLRVYELAKELDMTNKDLVERVHSLGIHIKGHMSSLDEEQAQLVRDMVAGRSRQTIEEKRVRPGVIRRRRKMVRTKLPVQTVESEETTETAPPSEAFTEVPGQEAPPVETPVEEESPPPVAEEHVPQSETGVEEGSEAKPQAPGSDEAAPAKEAPKKKKKDRKLRSRVKKDFPAKVIKLPERVPEGLPESVP
ncbi:MAG: translation initiation factor IF-2 N-terminal domain-containing protein, partial [Syntrophobacteria bacterium]